MHVAGDGRHVVGRLQGLAHGPLVELALGAGVEVGVDADDGAIDRLAAAPDGPQDGPSRVGAGGVDLDGQEGTAVHGAELVGHATAAGGEGGVQIHEVEALLLALLAEVHRLQAARIDQRRASETARILVLVQVTEGHVVDPRRLEGAGREHVVLPHHHLPL